MKLHRACRYSISIAASFLFACGDAAWTKLETRTSVEATRASDRDAAAVDLNKPIIALDEALTINATALTEQQFIIAQSGSAIGGWLPTNVEQDVTLSPGAYEFKTVGGRFGFIINSAGLFEIADPLTGFVAVEDGGKRLTVRGHSFTFDARSLSEPQFVFFGNNSSDVGYSSDFMSTSAPQTVTFIPGGGYSFMTYGGLLSFQIGLDGGFRNTSNCPTCFVATGSSVGVHGFTYTFDATVLSEPKIAFFGKNGRNANWATPFTPTSAPVAYELLPGGRYWFSTYGGTLAFTLEGDGTFTNQSNCSSCFQVSGSTVTVPGFAVNIDPRALSEAYFSLIGNNGWTGNWSTPALTTTTPYTFVLIPGGVYRFSTPGGWVDFRLSSAGLFEDVTGCPGCWNRSGNSITMVGFTFQISGSALFEKEFYVHGHNIQWSGYSTNWLPTCASHEVTLLPGNYSLRTRALVQYFQVNTAGTLTLNPTPGEWLSVDPSGTQLAVRGYPVTLQANFAGETRYALIGTTVGPSFIGLLNVGQSYCLNLAPGSYAFGWPSSVRMSIANDGGITVNDPRVSATAQDSLCANPQCSTNHPPLCGLATTHADVWPPNHRFVPIQIMNVSDPDGDPVTVSVGSIFQDEPPNGSGDGDAAPDAVRQGGTAFIRSERAGGGNGRAYRVEFSADDGHGGTCSGAVNVCVPHDQNPHGTCVDDGTRYNSFGP